MIIGCEVKSNEISVCSYDRENDKLSSITTLSGAPDLADYIAGLKEESPQIVLTAQKQHQTAANQCVSYLKTVYENVHLIDPAQALAFLRSGVPDEAELIFFSKTPLKATYTHFCKGEAHTNYEIKYIDDAFDPLLDWLYQDAQKTYIVFDDEGVCYANAGDKDDNILIFKNSSILSEGCCYAALCAEQNEPATPVQDFSDLATEQEQEFAIDEVEFDEVEYPDNENEETVNSLFALSNSHIVLADGAKLLKKDYLGNSESVDFSNRIDKLAAAPDHIAVLSGGKVTCFGNNEHGQCYTEDFCDVKDVICGVHFTCALKNDGSLCFAGVHPNPAVMHALSSMNNIAVFGNESIFALQKRNGELLVFGLNGDCKGKVFHFQHDLKQLSFADTYGIALFEDGSLQILGKSPFQDLPLLGEPYIAAFAKQNYIALLSHGSLKTIGVNDATIHGIQPDAVFAANEGIYCYSKQDGFCFLPHRNQAVKPFIAEQFSRLEEESI